MENITKMDTSSVNNSHYTNGSFGTHCRQNYYGSTFQTYKIVVDVYIVGVLCVLGITGNVMSFFVLRRMSGCAAPRLLQALAAADTALLLTCLVFQTVRVVFFYGVSEELTLFPYVEVWVWPFAGITQMSAVYITVLVTMDRWRAVCFPLHSRQSHNTYKHFIMRITAVVMGSIIFNLPLFMDMEVHWIPATCRMEARASTLYVNRHYQLIYKSILCFLVRTFIPLVIIIVLNVRLVHAIRLSQRQQLTSQRTSRDKHSLNILVCVLLFVFILCSTPDAIFRAVHAFMTYFPDLLLLDMSHIAYMATFTNLMLTLSSSVNFIIYCLTGTRFRQEIKKMFGINNTNQYKKKSIILTRLSSYTTSFLKKRANSDITSFV